MEIVISKSKKPDKKYDARIDGKKQLVLVIHHIKITDNIKIKNAKRLI